MKKNLILFLSLIFQHGHFLMAQEYLPGDANKDYTIDSADLVQMMASGKYNALDGSATWEEGDFNGDSLFDSRDLVLMFQEGKYESGSYRKECNIEGLDSVAFRDEPICSDNIPESVFRLLDVEDHDTYAVKVNERGEVLGGRFLSIYGNSYPWHSGFYHQQLGGTLSDAEMMPARGILWRGSAYEQICTDKNGEWCVGLDLNNNGEVVGAFGNERSMQAFLYQSPALQILPTGNYYSSAAFSINDMSQIGGVVHSPPPQKNSMYTEKFPAIWQRFATAPDTSVVQAVKDTVYNDYESLTSYSLSSYLEKLNDMNIDGTFRLEQRIFGTIWDVNNLGTISGTAVAESYAVDNSESTYGGARKIASDSLIFSIDSQNWFNFYDCGSIERFTDPHCLKLKIGYPNFTSNNGTQIFNLEKDFVTSDFMIKSREFAFIRNGSSIIELPHLSNNLSNFTKALGANDIGAIVGWAESEVHLKSSSGFEFYNGNRRAVVWTTTGIYDLNNSLPPDYPWLLIEATDINNCGKIVGNAVDKRSGSHTKGFVLKPPYCP